jgi:hypothetical protein
MEMRWGEGLMDAISCVREEDRELNVGLGEVGKALSVGEAAWAEVAAAMTLA